MLAGIPPTLAVANPLTYPWRVWSTVWAAARWGLGATVLDVVRRAQQLEGAGPRGCPAELVRARRFCTALHS